MDLKALILVGSPAGDNNAPQTGSVAGVPFACLDVLGASVLERLTKRLKTAGISQLALISAAGADAHMHMERAIHKSRLEVVSAAKEDFWQSAEQTFEAFRQNGADLVLVLKLGPYVEVDFEEVILHHINKRCRMTSVTAADGASLGIFVLDSTRRGDASTLFRSGLQKVRDDCERFVPAGYVNLLQTVADFRRLALDGLLQKNAIRPSGKQVRPGVWVGDGATIHRKARVLAPAFIGAYSKVRAASLVTRNSVLEHHAEVDCGTVVENSTVLPYTYVGAGLDVMHSVVGFHRIWHLLRNVEVEIPDTRLVGITPASTVFRTVGSAAAFFAVLPKQIYRGFLGRARKIRPARLPESLESPAATLVTPDVEQPASGQEVGDFPSTFAVVRRYGEH